jgi:uncharacterized membrane protein
MLLVAYYVIHARAMEKRGEEKAGFMQKFFRTIEEISSI